MTRDPNRRPYLEAFRRHTPPDEWFREMYGDDAVAKEREVGARWPELPPLTDDERARVHALIDQFASEQQVHAEQHRDRLRRVGYSLGRSVARGELTVERANGRLDAVMCSTSTGPGPDILLVPWREAEQIVDDAYANGVREARHGR